MADAQAFAAFYQATLRGLVAQLLAYPGDLGEAQDAAQEAYVRAWLRWRQVSTYDDPRAGVSRVGHHLVVSRWRRGRTALATMWRHGPRPAPREPDPTRPDLVAALRRLPEPQRRALVLFYLGGFAVNEIASMENAPDGHHQGPPRPRTPALATLLATTETVDVGKQ